MLSIVLLGLAAAPPTRKVHALHELERTAAADVEADSGAADSEQRHSFTNGVLFGVMLIYNAVVVSLALAECSEAGGDGCM